ncbi:MAG TPA: hypothetical protein VF519_15440 [Mycobacteriales bacterium]|jgi:hypothetical protein
MNRRLAVAAAAAVAASLTAVPAHAAKVLCLQLTDPEGDGSILGTVPQSQDALDIVSGDIATGRKNVVAVLRMKSLNADTPLGGRQYQFAFTAGGVTYTLTHTVNLDGTTRGSLGDGTGTTPVDAVVDASSGSVTWTVPRKAVAALKTSGAKISGLTGKASYSVAMQVPGGTYDSATPSDLAESGKTYVDGTPTCLRGV